MLSYFWEISQEVTQFESHLQNNHPISPRIKQAAVLETLPEQDKDIRQQKKSDEGCMWKDDVFTGKFRQQSGGGALLNCHQPSCVIDV